MGVERSAVRGNVVGNKTGIVIVLFTFGWCVVYERGFSCERCVQTKCVCVASEAIYHWGMNRMVLGTVATCLHFNISKLFQTKTMHEQSMNHISSVKNGSPGCCAVLHIA